MELRDILAKGSVFRLSGIADKSELLHTLAEKAAAELRLDGAAILDALSARESLGSTGLGGGIAIPHGKLAALATVQAIFAVLDRPIEFDSVDDQPVDVVMVLLAPVGAGAEHLKALSRVARLLRTEAIVEDLRHAKDAARLYAILTAPVPADRAA